MKVEQNKTFQPITITLETEFEARVLKTLVGHVIGTTKFRNTADDLYIKLDSLRVKSFKCSGGFNSSSVELGS